MEPKRKKFGNIYSKIEPFPFEEITENNILLLGIFNGLTVDVFNEHQIKSLALKGCFGQGSKSRSLPTAARTNYNPNKIQTISERQYTTRLNWRERFKITEIFEDVKVIGNDEKFSEIKSNPFQVPETMSLFLEEAFFLNHCLKCLAVKNLDGKTFESDELLNIFCQTKPNFISSYVAYLYFKSRNWVIRSGMKFAGQYLLYQKGPHINHASYIVHIQDQDENQLDNYGLQSMIRISETTAKELLILEIYYPNRIDRNDYQKCLQLLDKFEVCEVYPKRYSFTSENKLSTPSTSLSGTRKR